QIPPHYGQWPRVPASVTAFAVTEDENLVSVLRDAEPRRCGFAEIDLMHILISFCNRKVPEMPALALVDPEAGGLSIVSLSSEVPRFSGITGLAADRRHLYAAIRACEEPGGRGFTGPSSLLIFDLQELRLLNHYTFRHVIDAHSIYAAEHGLFVVST